MTKIIRASLYLLLLSGTLALLPLIPSGWKSLHAQEVASPKAPAVPIHFAALKGDVATIEQHIEVGTDLDQVDSYGSTPLVIALTFGHEAVAERLISAGADLEQQTAEGSHPLHLAAFFGRTSSAELLLKQGANRFARTASGSSAYDIAAVSAQVDLSIFTLLKKQLGSLGFDPDMERVDAARNQIAQLLKPSPKELAAVEWTPEPRPDHPVRQPKDAGVDEALLSELFLDASKLKTAYGLMVLKDGHLLGEAYFNGADTEQRERRASVTKSLLSVLVGIALEQGCLRSLEQPMLEFFNPEEVKLADERKRQITLRHMLQMRAGFPWEETAPDYWDLLWSGKYASSIDQFPLSTDPGEKFQYSNMTSNWLGIIVARACRTQLDHFARQHLFQPMGIDFTSEWQKDADGYTIGAAGIRLSAYELVRFGHLILQEGRYRDRQIVGADWVRASLKPSSTDAWKTPRVGRYFKDIAYGYHWWSAKVGAHPVHFAWGHGGNLVVILKEQKVVVVITSDPFYGKERYYESWTDEQANFNVVGKFIQRLSSETQGAEE